MIDPTRELDIVTRWLDDSKVVKVAVVALGLALLADLYVRDAVRMWFYRRRTYR